MNFQKIYLMEETPICYDSTECFRHEFRKVLKELQVETQEGSSPGKNCADAVIGINSEWVMKKDKDGKNIADETGIPFYQIILDHPLYHHELLKLQLQDYHVICLDEKHKQYIEKYYPDIRSVDVMSLSIPFCPELQDNFEEYWERKKVNLLFTGTYTSTAMLRKKWEILPESIRAEVWELAQRMVETPSKTQEEVLLEMIAEHPEAPFISKERFREAMNMYFLADTYASAFYRENAVAELLHAGVPIDVVGYGWDIFCCLNGISGAQEKLLMRHGEVQYKNTAQLMKSAKACLNIQPWFKAGIHDRIISAMGQGSCVLSDATPLLQKVFGEEETVYFYQLEQPEQISALYMQMIKDEEQMKKRAEKGYFLAAGKLSLKYQLGKWLGAGR